MRREGGGMVQEKLALAGSFTTLAHEIELVGSTVDWVESARPG